MRTSIHALIGALTLGAAVSALAGPDWQAIERARKAQQTTEGAQHGDASALPASKVAKCRPEPTVLALDHGPHAQTTPYENRLRQERNEAQPTMC